MIVVTDVAAEVLKSTMREDKVVRMFLVNIDATGANYNLGWGDPLDDDKVFECNGIKIYMTPDDTEMLGESETIIDYVETEELGRGFVIQGPEEDSCECGYDHEHGDCGC